jgi:16S rRNA (guanine527-N7)-methyltransferase
MMTNGLADLFKKLDIENTHHCQHQLTRYIQLLTARNHKTNLISRRSKDIWQEHILPSLAYLPFLPDSGACADIGSGAGLPGIVVAITRPHLSITLIESNRLKALFCQHCQRELGLGNVRVVRVRAEELSNSYDCIMFRAVAAATYLQRIAQPLLTEAGHFLSLKGCQEETEASGIGAELFRLPAYFEAHWPAAKRYAMLQKKKDL